MSECWPCPCSFGGESTTKVGHWCFSPCKTHFVWPLFGQSQRCRWPHTSDESRWNWTHSEARISECSQSDGISNGGFWVWETLAKVSVLPVETTSLNTGVASFAFWGNPLMSFASSLLVSMAAYCITWLKEYHPVCDFCLSRYDPHNSGTVNGEKLMKSFGISILNDGRGPVHGELIPIKDQSFLDTNQQMWENLLFKAVQVCQLTQSRFCYE